MDKVRFGRALGYGARHAAKALMSAADAATAPDPTASQPQTRPASAQPSPAQSQSAASTMREAAVRTVTTANAVRAQAARQKQSMAASVKRHTRAVVLKTAGTLFAFFAVSFGVGLWRVRAGFHASLHSSAGRGVYFALAAFVLFAYFAVSSFVRARKLERGG